MRILEFLLVRSLLWVGVPLLLVVLIVGPSRVKRMVSSAWNYLFAKRLNPETILTDVVRQHHQHVSKVRTALTSAETAERAIASNMHRSEENVSILEAESRNAAQQGDEAAAKVAIFKLNLEKAALDNFKAQHVKQLELLAEARRRLYLLELQLRQYEVGRSILLSELAQAKNVEEQYDIASQFDPFNAVADWKRAEGLVEEQALAARAIERVYTDTADPITIAGQPVEVDPVVLQNQLRELQQRMLTDAATIKPATSDNNASHPHVTKKQEEQTH